MLGIADLETVLNPASSQSDVLAALQGLELQHVNSALLAATVEKLRNSADVHADLLSDLSELSAFTIDCAGTGGSGMSHFNTSTSVAFVLAAAGFKVAKFGGRAASGKAGSFDFLEALGISSDLPAQDIADALSVCGIAFIYAPKIYPHLKRLAPLRKQHGKPTVFNYVGPLLNPVRPATRLMGISSDQARKLVAEYILSENHSRTALLVTAGGLLDEFTTNAINEVSFINEGQIQEFQLDAQGLELFRQDHLPNGKNGQLDLEAGNNAEIFSAIINGEDSSSTAYKMILLNAAAALFTLKACHSIGEGITIAAELISGGAVAESLATCRRFYERIS